MQGLILLKKPKGITSYSAVAKIKYLCGEKRVGHTGTLDPLATGVLPILIGKPTALSGYMLDGDKRYIAKVKLGIVTDTDDITGKIIETRDVNITEKQLCDALGKFSGVIKQRPPIYSALKQNGVPLYKLARKGEKVETSEREITVHSISLLSGIEADNTFKIETLVSKGTYIRSLVRDIGEALGCGATLTELERTSASGVEISQCVDLDVLNYENITDYIISEDRAVSHFDAVGVTENQAVRFSNGGALSLERLRKNDIKDNEFYRVYFGDIFLGIGFADEQKKELSVKCVVNYPKVKTGIALGTFDGVHIGHKKVLDLPDDCKKIAVCFNKPPKAILSGVDELICDTAKKEKTLNKIGIDEIYTLDFEKIKNMGAKEFLQFLKDKFSPDVISCGFNYKFGMNALGDTALLEEFAEQNAIKLICAAAVKRDGKVVSSTLIRDLLKNGEIEAANMLMVDKFSFSAPVISGDKRGRTIGFPTVNQRYPEEMVKLKFGVYKSKVYFDKKEYEGITNIGKRPTYPSDYVISETYIKDFIGDLYGKNITVYPIKFLREELKFSSIDELKKQIELDLQS